MPAHDYDEEARMLWSRLNLPEDGSGVVPGRYNPMDVIFQDKNTGARVYVGNYTAAANKELLKSHQISHIVNCQEATTENYFEGTPGFHYTRFLISHWRVVPNIRDPKVVDEFFGKVFRWVDSALARGESVLIHCLAGAHRAGTAGTAYLMHAAQLPADMAIQAAKKMRPAISPICDFPTLLSYYEKAIFPAGK